MSLSHAADGAYILLHDAFHFGVSEAIRETVDDEPRLHDCGYVCNAPRPVGDLMTHAGFRLPRVGAAVTDVEALVRPAWEAVGKQPPHDRALLNHGGLCETPYREGYSAGYVEM